MFVSCYHIFLPFTQISSQRSTHLQFMKINIAFSFHVQFNYFTFYSLTKFSRSPFSFVSPAFSSSAIIWLTNIFFFLLLCLSLIFISIQFNSWFIFHSLFSFPSSFVFPFFLDSIIVTTSLNFITSPYFSFSTFFFHFDFFSFFFSLLFPKIPFLFLISHFLLFKYFLFFS